MQPATAAAVESREFAAIPISAVVTFMANAEKQRHDENVDRAVTAAMQAGRLPPALETWGRDLCPDKPDEFDRFLKSSPFNLETPTATALGKPPVFASALAPAPGSWEDDRVSLQNDSGHIDNTVVIMRKRGGAGLPLKIDRGPELRDFILIHIQHLPYGEIVRKLAERFPPYRRISKSALSRCWTKERSNKAASDAPSLPTIAKYGLIPDKGFHSRIIGNTTPLRHFPKPPSTPSASLRRLRFIPYCSVPPIG